SKAGYPPPPLQLVDELTLTLPKKIMTATRAGVEAAGLEYVPPPAEPVIDKMLEAGREGRSGGAGFYDYDDSGNRQKLWPGLFDMFDIEDDRTLHADDVDQLRDMSERMLFGEAIETVKCFDEGVITSYADANIGSIFGIGFPAWTGGVAQYIDQYPGGTTGFVARCKELTDRYGDRFIPPPSLAARAETGEPFRPPGAR
ncbi:MAG: 3-hydroxyacyl-CoA dehydrogenase family protein, partial [Acidimicrobiia bacterium]|nr:3-hydroxyacyl-CoA dehydrogenase family protein [Acidimicrobiia bacterium]